MFKKVNNTIYRQPEILALLGVSKATLQRMVKEGRFPSPFKISHRLNGWKVEDVNHWLKNIGKQ